MDLELTCRGDTQVDFHHTVEDVGICLGQALRQALGEGAGIRRFGHAFAPMDEALALAALDVSGRGHCELDLSLATPKIGDFDSELVTEFMRAFATNAGVTLHVRQVAGVNSHHIVEAAFKALALALREGRRPRSPAHRYPRPRDPSYEPGPPGRCHSRLPDGQLAQRQRRSRCPALRRIAHRPGAQVGAVDGLVLPGVGAFGDAMDHLRTLGFEPLVLDAVERGTPSWASA